MPDLIAQSTDATHFWRRPLELGEPVLVGRTSGQAAVPWDSKISRCHARVRWTGKVLHVERMPEAKNPIYFGGDAVDRCDLEVGERFVIGNTTFLLVDSADSHAESHPPPVSVQALHRNEIQMQRFHEAAQRIDALARLPRLISPADTDPQLARRIARLLLDGVTKATAAAVIHFDPADGERYTILHGESRRRARGEFRPSLRLLRQVAESGEGTLHLWDSSADDSAARLPTQRAGVDWAFCLPVEGESQLWCLYVEGGEEDGHTVFKDSAFEDDIKFAQIVATMVANFRSARMWERRHAHMRPFFSPSVLQWLDRESDGRLEPKKVDVCVLFCDLRGFSRESELSADDLLALLQRVGRTLGVMTTYILNSGGVIGDFHGDAAMGFWGWPVAHPRQAAQACRAALNIRRQLAAGLAAADEPLPDFQAGLGLASGEAVAGPIGTADQLKVTVFGPVVNRAARLETLTKALKAPVLLDQATAGALRSLGDGDWRLRRLGRVELPRMGRIEQIYELLPPVSQCPELSDQAVEDFEAAVAAFEQGDWEIAFELFHEVPHYDQVKDYYVGEIVRHSRRPPSGWEGVLRPGAG